MKDERYNGWQNYQTWNVKLWMDNGSADYYREVAKDMLENATATEYQTREQSAIYDLSERLKDEFENSRPELEGCYSDLLCNALSNVDWREIAENIIGEIDDDFATPAEMDAYNARINEGAIKFNKFTATLPKWIHRDKFMDLYLMTERERQAWLQNNAPYFPAQLQRIRSTEVVGKVRI